MRSINLQKRTRHFPNTDRTSYRKIPIISPGLIFVLKAVCWAYFRGSLFPEGLIIGRNFAFQNRLGLTIKTADSNSPWAYIREGLLSEEYYFVSEIWGTYFREGLLSEFYASSIIIK